MPPTAHSPHHFSFVSADSLLEARPELPKSTSNGAPARAQAKTLLIHLVGIVQGVGFRPFVYRLATSLELSGWIRNTSAGATILVQGEITALEEFQARLLSEAPPLACISECSIKQVPHETILGFQILPSSAAQTHTAWLPPDTATCQECLAELFDPEDRRFRYPFINCVNCGPRFTIIRRLPYDRPSTTMAPFALCPECAREFTDPADRRFHAQPIACPKCGPKLVLGRPRRNAPHGEILWTEQGDLALRSAARLLLNGAIVAIKGLGGYHLACDACNEEAVRTLRQRKLRDSKPFAVMAANVEVVRRYCHLSVAEEEILLSPAHPILLLDRNTPEPTGNSSLPDLAPSVAPGTHRYGFFLPYTPLHHLLMSEAGIPLVMTSGNSSDEPLAFREPEAWQVLAPLADAILAHDRPINVRLDDSVGQVFRGVYYPLRRARGFVPSPVRFLGHPLELLACGGHQKNTFCLTRQDLAFVGPHIGDLSSHETRQAFLEQLHHLIHTLGFKPALLIHDLHPGYMSTRLAWELAERWGVPTYAVQHHEAHIAALVADCAYSGPIVGLAFDGAGLGTDATIWGGEFFVGEPAAFVRAAHLEVFPLLGGDLAAREPWRAAIGLLYLVAQQKGLPLSWIGQIIDRIPGLHPLLARPWVKLLKAYEAGVTGRLTSSAGRLFDGIAALLGFAHETSFEGEAAFMLEAAAHAASRGQQVGLSKAWYRAVDFRPARTTLEDPLIVPIVPFIEATLSDLYNGETRQNIAYRFHWALAQCCARMAIHLAKKADVAAVGLSGGVFQNTVFLELVVQALEAAGLEVLTHRQVPPNDGGLSLGQVEVAAARWTASERR